MESCLTDFNMEDIFKPFDEEYQHEDELTELLGPHTPVILRRNKPSRTTRRISMPSSMFSDLQRWVRNKSQ